MIIKGKSHSGAYTGRGGGNLGTYLLKEKNARAEVLDIRGDLRRDLPELVDDWRSDAVGSQCKKPLYHAMLNPDRVLTMEEWNTALAIFEQEMGFQDQPRALVLHEHKGRTHLHVVYSRLDENGKAISDSWNYVRHERAARGIEQALGLEPIQGAFTHPDRERPERSPDEDEVAQAKKRGQDAKAIKAEIRAIFEASATGQDFKEALEAAGYSLAKGDSRDFVIVDSQGGIHTARATGAKAAELRAFMADVDREALPTAQEAQDAREQQEAEERRREAERQRRAGEDAEAEESRGDTAGPDPDAIRAWAQTYKDILAKNRAAPAPTLAPGSEGQAAALGYLQARAEWANRRAAEEPRPMHPDDHAAALREAESQGGGDRERYAAWMAKIQRAELGRDFEAAGQEATEPAPQEQTPAPLREAMSPEEREAQEEAERQTNLAAFDRMRQEIEERQKTQRQEQRQGPQQSM